MGSNEVIIDGCNVAECELCSTDWKNRYVCEITSISMKYNHFCNENPNCHFKQLQRAKAEKQDLINYFHLREGGMLEDIQYWKNKAQELYKELEQYKKSKQASYESMQKEWNAAINEYRKIILENENLHITIEKLKGDLYIAEDSLRDYQEHYNKLDAENEKLKADNNALKDALFKVKDTIDNGCYPEFDWLVLNEG